MGYMYGEESRVGKQDQDDLLPVIRNRRPSQAYENHVSGWEFARISNVKYSCVAHIDNHGSIDHMSTIESDNDGMETRRIPEEACRGNDWYIGFLHHS